MDRKSFAKRSSLNADGSQDYFIKCYSRNSIKKPRLDPNAETLVSKLGYDSRRFEIITECMEKFGLKRKSSNGDERECKRMRAEHILDAKEKSCASNNKNVLVHNKETLQVKGHQSSIMLPSSEFNATEKGSKNKSLVMKSFGEKLQNMKNSGCFSTKKGKNERVQKWQEIQISTNYLSAPSGEGNKNMFIVSEASFLNDNNHQECISPGLFSSNLLPTSSFQVQNVAQIDFSLASKPNIFDICAKSSNITVNKTCTRASMADEVLVTKAMVFNKKLGEIFSKRKSRMVVEKSENAKCISSFMPNLVSFNSESKSVVNSFTILEKTHNSGEKNLEGFLKASQVASRSSVTVVDPASSVDPLLHSIQERLDPSDQPLEACYSVSHLPDLPSENSVFARDDVLASTFQLERWPLVSLDFEKFKNLISFRGSGQTEDVLDKGSESSDLNVALNAENVSCNKKFDGNNLTEVFSSRESTQLSNKPRKKLLLKRKKVEHVKRMRRLVNKMQVKYFKLELRRKDGKRMFASCLMSKRNLQSNNLLLPVCNEISGNKEKSVQEESSGGMLVSCNHPSVNAASYSSNYKDDKITPMDMSSPAGESSCPGVIEVQVVYRSAENQDSISHENISSDNGISNGSEDMQSSTAVKFDADNSLKSFNQVFDESNIKDCSINSTTHEHVEHKEENECPENKNLSTIQSLDLCFAEHNCEEEDDVEDSVMSIWSFCKEANAGFDTREVPAQSFNSEMDKNSEKDGWNQSVKFCDAIKDHQSDDNNNSLNILNEVFLSPSWLPVVPQSSSEECSNTETVSSTGHQSFSESADVHESDMTDKRIVDTSDPHYCTPGHVFDVGMNNDHHAPSPYDISVSPVEQFQLKKLDVFCSKGSSGDFVYAGCDNDFGLSNHNSCVMPQSNISAQSSDKQDALNNTDEKIRSPSMDEGSNKQSDSSDSALYNMICQTNFEVLLNIKQMNTFHETSIPNTSSKSFDCERCNLFPVCADGDDDDGIVEGSTEAVDLSELVTKHLRSEYSSLLTPACVTQQCRDASTLSLDLGHLNYKPSFDSDHDVRLHQGCDMDWTTSKFDAAQSECEGSIGNEDISQNLTNADSRDDIATCQNTNDDYCQDKDERKMTFDGNITFSHENDVTLSTIVGNNILDNDDEEEQNKPEPNTCLGENGSMISSFDVDRNEGINKSCYINESCSEHNIYDDDDDDKVLIDCTYHGGGEHSKTGNTDANLKGSHFGHFEVDDDDDGDEGKDNVTVDSDTHSNAMIVSYDKISLFGFDSDSDIEDSADNSNEKSRPDEDKCEESVGVHSNEIVKEGNSDVISRYCGDDGDCDADDGNVDAGLAKKLDNVSVSLDGESVCGSCVVSDNEMQGEPDGLAQSLIETKNIKLHGIKNENDDNDSDDLDDSSCVTFEVAECGSGGDDSGDVESEIEDKWNFNDHFSISKAMDSNDHDDEDKKSLVHYPLIVNKQTFVTADDHWLSDLSESDDCISNCDNNDNNDDGTDIKINVNFDHSLDKNHACLDDMYYRKGQRSHEGVIVNRSDVDDDNDEDGVSVSNRGTFDSDDDNDDHKNNPEVIDRDSHKACSVDGMAEYDCSENEEINQDESFDFSSPYHLVASPRSPDPEIKDNDIVGTSESSGNNDAVLSKIIEWPDAEEHDHVVKSQSGDGFQACGYALNDDSEVDDDDGDGDSDRNNIDTIVVGEDLQAGSYVHGDDSDIDDDCGDNSDKNNVGTNKDVNQVDAAENLDESEIDKNVWNFAGNSNSESDNYDDISSPFQEGSNSDNDDDDDDDGVCDADKKSERSSTFSIKGEVVSSNPGFSGEACNDHHGEEIRTLRNESGLEVGEYRDNLVQIYSSDDDYDNANDLKKDYITSWSNEINGDDDDANSGNVDDNEESPALNINTKDNLANKNLPGHPKYEDFLTKNDDDYGVQDKSISEKYFSSDDSNDDHEEHNHKNDDVDGDDDRSNNICEGNREDGDDDVFYKKPTSCLGDDENNSDDDHDVCDDMGPGNILGAMHTENKSSCNLSEGNNSPSQNQAAIVNPPPNLTQEFSEILSKQEPTDPISSDGVSTFDNNESNLDTNMMLNVVIKSDLDSDNEAISKQYDELIDNCGNLYDGLPAVQCIKSDEGAEFPDQASADIQSIMAEYTEIYNRMGYANSSINLYGHFGNVSHTMVDHLYGDFDDSYNAFSLSESQASIYKHYFANTYRDFYSAYNYGNSYDIYRHYNNLIKVHSRPYPYVPNQEEEHDCLDLRIKTNQNTAVQSYDMNASMHREMESSGNHEASDSTPMDLVNKGGSNYSTSVPYQVPYPKSNIFSSFEAMDDEVDIKYPICEETGQFVWQNSFSHGDNSEAKFTFTHPEFQSYFDKACNYTNNDGDDDDDGDPVSIGDFVDFGHQPTNQNQSDDIKYNIRNNDGDHLESVRDSSNIYGSENEPCGHKVIDKRKSHNDCESGICNGVDKEEESRSKVESYVKSDLQCVEEIEKFHIGQGTNSVEKDDASSAHIDHSPMYHHEASDDDNDGTEAKHVDQSSIHHHEKSDDDNDGDCGGGTEPKHVDQSSIHHHETSDVDNDGDCNDSTEPKNIDQSSTHYEASDDGDDGDCDDGTEPKHVDQSSIHHHETSDDELFDDIDSDEYYEDHASNNDNAGNSIIQIPGVRKNTSSNSELGDVMDVKICFDEGSVSSYDFGDRPFRETRTRQEIPYSPACSWNENLEKDLNSVENRGESEDLSHDISAPLNLTLKSSEHAPLQTDSKSSESSETQELVPVNFSPGKKHLLADASMMSQNKSDTDCHGSTLCKDYQSPGDTFLSADAGIKEICNGGISYQASRTVNKCIEGVNQLFVGGNTNDSKSCLYNLPVIDGNAKECPKVCDDGNANERDENIDGMGDSFESGVDDSEKETHDKDYDPDFGGKNPTEMKQERYDMCSNRLDKTDCLNKVQKDTIETDGIVEFNFSKTLSSAPCEVDSINDMDIKNPETDLNESNCAEECDPATVEHLDHQNNNNHKIVDTVVENDILPDGIPFTLVSNLPSQEASPCENASLCDGSPDVTRSALADADHGNKAISPSNHSFIKDDPLPLDIDGYDKGDIFSSGDAGIIESRIRHVESESISDKEMCTDNENSEKVECLIGEICANDSNCLSRACDQYGDQYEEYVISTEVYDEHGFVCTNEDHLQHEAGKSMVSDYADASVIGDQMSVSQNEKNSEPHTSKVITSIKFGHNDNDEIVSKIVTECINSCNHCCGINIEQCAKSQNEKETVSPTVNINSYERDNDFVLLNKDVASIKIDDDVNMEVCLVGSYVDAATAKEGSTFDQPADSHKDFVSLVEINVVTNYLEEPIAEENQESRAVDVSSLNVHKEMAECDNVPDKGHEFYNNETEPEKPNCSKIASPVKDISPEGSFADEGSAAINPDNIDSKKVDEVNNNDNVICINETGTEMAVRVLEEPDVDSIQSSDMIKSACSSVDDEACNYKNSNVKDASGWLDDVLELSFDQEIKCSPTENKKNEDVSVIDESSTVYIESCQDPQRIDLKDCKKLSGHLDSPVNVEVITIDRPNPEVDNNVFSRPSKNELLDSQDPKNVTNCSLNAEFVNSNTETLTESLSKKVEHQVFDKNIFDELDKLSSSHFKETVLLSCQSIAHCSCDILNTGVADRASTFCSGEVIIYNSSFLSDTIGSEVPSGNVTKTSLEQDYRSNPDEDGKSLTSLLDGFEFSRKDFRGMCGMVPHPNGNPNPQGQENTSIVLRDEMVNDDPEELQAAVESILNIDFFSTKYVDEEVLPSVECNQFSERYGCDYFSNEQEAFISESLEETGGIAFIDNSILNEDDEDEDEASRDGKELAMQFYSSCQQKRDRKENEFDIQECSSLDKTSCCNDENSAPHNISNSKDGNFRGCSLQQNKANFFKSFKSKWLSMNTNYDPQHFEKQDSLALENALNVMDCRKKFIGMKKSKKILRNPIKIKQQKSQTKWHHMKMSHVIQKFQRLQFQAKRRKRIFHIWRRKSLKNAEGLNHLVVSFKSKLYIGYEPSDDYSLTDFKNKNIFYLGSPCGMSSCSYVRESERRDHLEGSTNVIQGRPLVRKPVFVYENCPLGIQRHSLEKSVKPVQPSIDQQQFAGLNNNPSSTSQAQLHSNSSCGFKDSKNRGSNQDLSCIISAAIKSSFDTGDCFRDDSYALVESERKNNLPYSNSSFGEIGGVQQVSCQMKCKQEADMACSSLPCYAGSSMSINSTNSQTLRSKPGTVYNMLPSYTELSDVCSPQKEKHSVNRPIRPTPLYNAGFPVTIGQGFSNYKLTHLSTQIPISETCCLPVVENIYNSHPVIPSENNPPTFVPQMKASLQNHLNSRLNLAPVHGYVPNIANPRMVVNRNDYHMLGVNYADHNSRNSIQSSSHYHLQHQYLPYANFPTSYRYPVSYPGYSSTGTFNVTPQSGVVSQEAESCRVAPENNASMNAGTRPQQTEKDPFKHAQVTSFNPKDVFDLRESYLPRQPSDLSNCGVYRQKGKKCEQLSTQNLAFPRSKIEKKYHGLHPSNFNVLHNTISKGGGSRAGSGRTSHKANYQIENILMNPGSGAQSRSYKQVVPPSLPSSNPSICHPYYQPGLDTGFTEIPIYKFYATPDRFYNYPTSAIDQSAEQYPRNHPYHYRTDANLPNVYRYSLSSNKLGGNSHRNY